MVVNDRLDFFFLVNAGVDDNLLYPSNEQRLATAHLGIDQRELLEICVVFFVSNLA